MGRVRRDLGIRPCAGEQTNIFAGFGRAQKQTGRCTRSIGGMGKIKLSCQNGKEEGYPAQARQI
eukprot:6333209-Heterocapsa_arctica.AAC.1